LQLGTLEWQHWFELAFSVALQRRSHIERKMGRIIGFFFDWEYRVFGQTRWLIVDDYMMLDTQHSYSDTNTIGLLVRSDA
jgi:hypothetical protein